MKRFLFLTFLISLLSSLISPASAQTDEKSRSISDGMRNYYDFDTPAESEISQNPTQGIGTPPRLFMFVPVGRIGPPSSDYGGGDLNGQYSEVGGSGGDRRAAVTAPTATAPPTSSPPQGAPPPPSKGSANVPPTARVDAPINNIPPGAENEGASERDLRADISRQIASGNVSSLSYHPSEQAEQDDRIYQAEQQRYRDIAGRIAAALRSEIAAASESDTPSVNSPGGPNARSPAASNTTGPNPPGVTNAEPAATPGTTSVDTPGPGGPNARPPEASNTTSPNSPGVTSAGPAATRSTTSVETPGRGGPNARRPAASNTTSPNSSGATNAGPAAALTGRQRSQLQQTIRADIARQISQTGTVEGFHPSARAVRDVRFARTEKAIWRDVAGRVASSLAGEATRGGRALAGRGKGRQRFGNAINGNGRSRYGRGRGRGHGGPQIGSTAPAVPGLRAPIQGVPSPVASSGNPGVANPGAPTSADGSLRQVDASASSTANSGAEAGEAPSGTPGSTETTGDGTVDGGAGGAMAGGAPGGFGLGSGFGLGMRPGGASARMAPAPPPPRPASPAPVQSSAPGRLTLNSAPSSPARTMPNSVAPRPGLQPQSIAPTGASDRSAMTPVAPNVARSSSTPAASSAAPAHAESAARVPAPSASNSTAIAPAARSELGLGARPSGVALPSARMAPAPPPPRPASTAPVQGTAPGRLALNSMPSSPVSRTTSNSAAPATPPAPAPSASKSPSATAAAHPEGTAGAPSASASKGAPTKANNAMKPTSANAGGGQPMWCNAITGKCTPAGSVPPPRSSPSQGGSRPCAPPGPGDTAVRECSSGAPPSQGNGGSHTGNPPRPTTSANAATGANPTNMPPTLPWLTNGNNPLFGPMQSADGGTLPGDPSSSGNSPDNTPSGAPSGSSNSAGNTGPGDESGSAPANSASNPGSSDQSGSGQSNSADNTGTGDQAASGQANSADNPAQGDQAGSNAAPNDRESSPADQQPADTATTNPNNAPPDASPRNAADNAPAAAPSNSDNQQTGTQSNDVAQNDSGSRGDAVRETSGDGVNSAVQSARQTASQLWEQGKPIVEEDLKKLAQENWKEIAFGDGPASIEFRLEKTAQHEITSQIKEANTTGFVDQCVDSFSNGNAVTRQACQLAVNKEESTIESFKDGVAGRVEQLKATLTALRDLPKTIKNIVNMESLEEDIKKITSR